MNHLGCQLHGQLLWLGFGINALKFLPFHCNSSESFLANLEWLLISATVFVVLTALLGIAGNLEYCIPPLIRGQVEKVFVGLLVNEQFGAIVAHTAECLNYSGQELDVIHRPCELNVAKVSGGLHIVKAICRTNETRFGHTHTRVVDAADDRLVVDESVTASDLRD